MKKEPTIIDNSLGRTIRKIRKLKKVSQHELGEKVGLSQVTISNIEKGAFLPKKNTLTAICDEFKMPYALLLLLSIEADKSEYKGQDDPSQDILKAISSYAISRIKPAK